MQQMAVSPNDLELRAKARAELERQQKEERYKFYIPNGKVERFIDLIGSGEVFVGLFSAANGVGKTACGVNIVAHILFDCSCSWFDKALFKNFPYLKRGRIVSDPTTISQKIVPELHMWLPQGRYTAARGDKHFDSKWSTDTGFKIDLMTYEQDTKEFESVDLGWAWFDEPPPEHIYKATVSRMRRGGIIFITETPLTGSAWLYDRFITSPDRII
jgi:phage terminase large subunit-like protein